MIPKVLFLKICDSEHGAGRKMNSKGVEIS